jgi:hypothetical protein
MAHQRPDITQLCDFVEKLQTDQGLSDDYREDPYGTIDATGLPPQKKELLKKRNLDAVEQAVRRECGPHVTAAWVAKRMVAAGPGGGADYMGDVVEVDVIEEIIVVTEGDENAGDDPSQ